MRYANIKKSGQYKHQNQTTTTTTININYIKNFKSVLQTKIKNKVKIVSDKTEAK